MNIANNASAPICGKPNTAVNSADANRSLQQKTKKTNHMPDDKTKHYKAIGFWHSEQEPYFPDPAWFIDKNWDAAERQIVIDYLKKGTAIVYYRGFSWCRFKCHGGFGTTDLTDGTYVYPEGLVHYIEEHDVRLPDDFIHHVKGIPSKSPSITARVLTIFRKNVNILETSYGKLDYNWWLSQKGFNPNQSYKNM